MPTGNQLSQRKRLLGWIGIVAVVIFTALSMLGASAIGVAKTPTTATLEEEDAGGAAAVDTPSGPSTATIDVTLSEWAITPSVSSVKAGVVTFNVKNSGPSKTHECIILKTDIAPDSLPTLSNHSLNEDGDGITSPGESHVLQVGGQQAVTVDMTPGKYVFVDNITEDGTIHWEKKAYAVFTVTP
jgi:uncharacterized cupredoxin-like copper-binding protein